MSLRNLEAAPEEAGHELKIFFLKIMKLHAVCWISERNIPFKDPCEIRRPDLFRKEGHLVVFTPEMENPCSAQWLSTVLGRVKLITLYHMGA